MTHEGFEILCVFYRGFEFSRRFLEPSGAFWQRVRFRAFFSNPLAFPRNLRSAEPLTNTPNLQQPGNPKNTRLERPLAFAKPYQFSSVVQGYASEGYNKQRVWEAAANFRTVRRWEARKSRNRNPVPFVAKHNVAEGSKFYAFSRTLWRILAKGS